MTPIEARFNDGMELANRMKGGGRAAYWGGYTAGLMRGLFGSLAVTDGQHRWLADLRTVGDEAVGYRDGYGEVLAALSTDGSGSDENLTGSPLTYWVMGADVPTKWESRASEALRAPAEAWENEGGAAANPA